jgi:hypothetical protein
MSESRFAYGNYQTGEVVEARLIRKTSHGHLLEPDIQGWADPETWVPGVIGPWSTGTDLFHSGDQSKKPPDGKWFVPSI